MGDFRSGVSWFQGTYLPTREGDLARAFPGLASRVGIVEDIVQDRTGQDRIG